MRDDDCYRHRERERIGYDGNIIGVADETTIHHYFKGYSLFMFVHFDFDIDYFVEHISIGLACQGKFDFDVCCKFCLYSYEFVFGDIDFHQFEDTATSNFDITIRNVVAYIDVIRLHVSHRKYAIHLTMDFKYHSSDLVLKNDKKYYD